MSRILPLLAIALPLCVGAQLSMPATSHADLQHLKVVAAKEPDARKLTLATQGRYPTAYIDGRCMVGFLGKVNDPFDPAAVDPAVRVGARVGDVLSFRVDAAHLDALHQIPGLTYAELAGKAAPTLDRVVRSTRADSVQRGINLPQTYTGRDVLIGVLDWGFDYTHPMFHDTAMAQSRIRAAWDQFKRSGPAPAPFGYGTAYTTPAELLAAQADTANIYSYATHGSHVAGIAGGGGAGTAYRGIAFDAQFVFCTFLVDAAAVLDAFAWMKSIADQDGKRLVVNMSWGLYHMGTLDGNSLISQAIDGYSADGVVFVNSGGNNGDVNFHIRKAFASDTLRSRVQFYSYSAHEHMWGQSISMWGEPGEDFRAGFEITTNGGQVLQATPWYHTATQPAYIDSFMVEGADTVFFNLTADAAHPLNGRPHFRLRVKNTSASLKITLKATAAEGVVHFWNVTELDNDVGNWGQAFQAPLNGWTVGDREYGISEPACTESLITVAAYNGEYQTGNGNWAGGNIAAFSSWGPTMDGRIKPDLAAPGVSVASSISSFTDNSYSSILNVPFEGRTYPFARFSGTSMSAPAVTGIVALLLEADPTLTPAEVKELLKSTARTDQQTGTIPAGGSTRWGMGKVNAYRAVCEALGVVGMDEVVVEGGVRLWPNPASDNVWIALPEVGVVEVRITDIAGRAVGSGRLTGAGPHLLDTGLLPAGAYLVRGRHAQGEFAVRFVKP
jgi:minor extracellular serine protease Vpr